MIQINEIYKQKVIPAEVYNNLCNDCEYVLSNFM